jgi:hypothetical protein
MPDGITINRGEDGEVREVRYLTDDRDLSRRCELIIGWGNNGDWYIATAPEKEMGIGRAVRICTSGGASSSVPGLPTLIAQMFRLLKEAGGVVDTWPFASASNGDSPPMPK